jgi:predicted nucleotidyltransferase
MDNPLNELLADLKRELERLYGPRLRGLYLFGSYARGGGDAESDVDVLIVLDAVPRYGVEVDRTGAMASQLSLEYGVTISRVFTAENDWLSADCPFLNNVRPEAIPA